MTILKEYHGYNDSFLNIVILVVLLCSLACVSAVFLCSLFSKKVKQGIVCLCLFTALVFVFWFNIKRNEFTIYKVVFTETKSLEEIQNEYEVMDTSGYMWWLKEK